MAITRLVPIGIALGGALAVASGAGARVDPPARFLFDGRVFTDGGVSWSFGRATPSTDDGGGAVDPDVARFAPPTLLCGAPQVETMPGTAGYGNVNLLGAGVSHDNSTPMLVILNSSIGRVQVVVGTQPAFEYNTLANPAKGDQSDFLRDSIDNSPDEAWSLKAAVVCHGVAVAMCSVAVRDGSNQFVTDRIGFATCRAGDLALPKAQWWRRLAMSDSLTACAGARLGNSWSLQTWFTPGQQGAVPARAWLAASDYRADPCKDGGLYCVLPLSRTFTDSSDWTVGAPVELPGRFVQTNGGTHAHAAAVARFGERGLVAFGARGDSLFNNTNYTWTIADEDDYLTGASVPAGASNYFTAPSQWTGPAQVHGSIIEPAAPVGQRAYGNQWIEAAPGPTPGTFLTGADETNQGLWLTTSLTDNPSSVEFTPVYAPMPANWIKPPGYAATGVGRYLCFHIAPAEPRWQSQGYVAQLGPSNSTNEWSLKARVLYSPDGLNWGQFWAHRENEQANVAMVGGRAYTGSIGLATSLGVRSTPLPAWRLARPIHVASGAMNYVRVDALTPYGPTPGVTVGPGTLPAPGGLPASRITIADPGASPPANYGVFSLAAGLPVDSGNIRFRFWVRGDTLAEGGRPSSLGFQFALRRWNPLVGLSSAVTSQMSPLAILPGAGQWAPMVYSCDLAPWAQDGDPANLDLVILPAGGAWVPNSFQIAAESLIVGNSLPAPVAPQAVGDDEVAALTLDTPESDWTVLLAGMVPRASWDGTFTEGWYASPSLVELSDATGDTQVHVIADVTSYKLRAWLWRDGAFQSQQAVISQTYWTTGSPVLIGVAHDAAGQTITLRASVGGTEIGSATLINTGPLALSRIRLCGTREGVAMTALDWFGGSVEGVRRPDTEINASLRSLDFLMPTPCASDFNLDGFVTGEDFDEFVEAFAFGMGSADFDGNGFVNGEDFDAFTIAFENGC